MPRPARRLLVVASLAVASVAVSPVASRQRQPAPGAFTVVEASIGDLRRAMEKGTTTSRALTEQYLARIARYGDRLHAVMAINPRASLDAEERDRERRQGRVRGPLHGIPVALKDNIQTLDMPTTGGALVFTGLRTPYEATLTRQLRDAGAVIVAKTTLTELANWVSSSMPPGYNAILGFSLNPYDPRTTTSGDAPVLTPGGSSSGIGTAVSFWAANVGTETSGSILNPANQNRLVGIKPTVGRISRYGVIPITADQDTPGPLARSVTDAAILLGAMERQMPDPNDPATRACTPPPGRDYTRYLRPNGLRGARIGVPRASFFGRVALRPGLGINLDDGSQRVMEEAIDALKKAGAIVVDPADLPSLVATDATRNLTQWSICMGRQDSRERPAACSIVLKYGTKRDFNRWLASLGDAAPVKTLTELRAWNRTHQPDRSIRFGQDQLDVSDEIDLEADRARYEGDRAKDLALTGREGIDAALAANKLDALIFPAFFAASIAARAGYPTVIVPFGTVTNGSPVGVSFTGTACAEPRLIEIAYAFEQATKRRVAPRLE